MLFETAFSYETLSGNFSFVLSLPEPNPEDKTIHAQSVSGFVDFAISYFCICK